MTRHALVTDFDGTVTATDFYTLIVERYMPPDAPDYWAEYRAGRMTHFEAMAAFFAYAPSDDAALARMLEETRPDPEFARAAEALRDAGWELIIVSAGSSWYIERILRAAGVAAAVHSNPGRIGRGLEIELDRAAPFFDAGVGVDKAAVVRDALARCEEVAFAGDGPPDAAPALLVDPRRRFARGYLAEELRTRGVPFQPFDRWPDIARRLLGREKL